MNNLDERMKQNYENRTRYYLPRRTATILRLDGKAFHTFTRVHKCTVPFDTALMSIMDITTQALCKNIQGVKLGFVQSDEISLLLTDFETEATQGWFNGNIQKMASVSASMATAQFNSLWKYEHSDMLAMFDTRVFTIPDPIEVENYFISRQRDATRNSIQSVAQTLYSPKELHGKNTLVLQEMIFQKGQNWNDLPAGCKRGRVIIYKDTQWLITDPPIFTQERGFLRSMIPQLPRFEEPNPQPPS